MTTCPERMYNNTMIIPMTSYCNTVVTDLEAEHVAVLTKDRGPSFLIGKDNFPGGHLEPGEDDQTAARREFEEETSLALQREQLVLISHKIMPTSELFTFAARVPYEELITVRTTTSEPVRVENVKAYQARLALEPAMAGPDVGESLTLAINTSNALDASPSF